LQVNGQRPFGKAEIARALNVFKIGAVYDDRWYFHTSEETEIPKAA